MERCGTSAFVVMYAIFSRFCYVGVVGDLGDPVVSTLGCASGDVVTAYACWDTKGHFLQSLALPSASQGPCERRRITVYTHNALHAHNLSPNDHPNPSHGKQIYPKEWLILQSSMRSISIMAPHGLIRTSVVTK